MHSGVEVIAMDNPRANKLTVISGRTFVAMTLKNQRRDFDTTIWERSARHATLGKSDALDELYPRQ
jgi:hypothetical protein